MKNIKLKPNQKLFIISGPSGVGKDTVIEGLKKFDLDFGWVITTTDRPIRKGEIQGKPYYHIPSEEFARKLREGEFIEYEYIHNFRYGTTFKALEDLLKQFQIVIWKGCPQSLENLQKIAPEAILIAILPPSFAFIEKRLRKRGSDSKVSIQERIILAKKEIEFLQPVKYKVINLENKPELASREIFEIIQKESR